MPDSGKLPPLGPHQGRKAFMLQSVPPREEPPGSERVAQGSGFSLRAGVAAEADQRGLIIFTFPCH
jgi:hypothetical protein